MNGRYILLKRKCPLYKNSYFTIKIFDIQVHFPSFMSDPAAGVKELERQKALGRIRYYGVSNYGPKNMKQLLEAGGKPVTNQVREMFK